MTDADDQQVLDAVLRAAREAAELPLTAEEDGETFVAFIVAAALRDLAEQGAYPEARQVRAALHRVSGYGLPA